MIGVIASTTDPFCADCDRARLTADGQLFTCLYATRGLDLRGPLRAGATDAELAALIRGVWQARRDRGAEARLGGRRPHVVRPAAPRSRPNRISRCTRAAADDRRRVPDARPGRRPSPAARTARGRPRPVRHRHRPRPGRTRGARAVLRSRRRTDPRPGRIGAGGTAPVSMCVAALGGYGRRALSLHSDIDLLIVFDGAIGAVEEAFLKARPPSALGSRLHGRPPGPDARRSADDRRRQPDVPAVAGRRPAADRQRRRSSRASIAAPRCSTATRAIRSSRRCCGSPPIATTRSTTRSTSSSPT